MLYVNLVLRNLTRSIKEYIVYMATLILSIMLIFAYNGMVFSPQVMLMSERAATFQATIIVVSVIIVFIIAWLIYYISNFILQKRSKEFGMYLLMGMTRRQVSLMFLGEQFILALIAFVIGCFLGIFLIQIMVMIVMHMLDQSYIFAIDVSMEGFLITAILFLIIFLFEFVREYHTLSKHKIYDLLYSEKKNETVSKNKVRSYGYCILAIGCFIVGVMLLDSFLRQMSSPSGTVNMIGFMLSIILLVASVYILFNGFSSLLTAYINHHKKLKYRGNVMYVYGQIAGRLRSNRSVLATLSVLTLTTLIFVCIGFKFGEVQTVGKDVLFPFDIRAVGSEKLDTSAISEYLNVQDIPFQEHTFTNYSMPNDKFSLLSEIAHEVGDYVVSEAGTYISLYDYNALRKLKGLEEIEMRDDQYILLVDGQCMDIVEGLFQNQPLILHGQNLQFHSFDTEPLGQASMDAVNMIIPDSFIAYGTIIDKIYSVNTQTPSSKEWINAFEDDFLRDNQIEQTQMNGNTMSIQSFAYVDVQANWADENNFSSMLINFCLFYFAIVFTCVSATIIATQQLSESMKQRYSYVMMWRMGVSKKELFALMRKQIAIYFFVPLIVPLLYAPLLLYIIDNLFQKTFASASLIPYFIGSLLFYIAINIGYYMLAYIGCKQHIKEVL